MKKLILAIAACSCLFAMNATASNKWGSYEKKEQKKQLHNKKYFALKADMRKLWEDHITWTRNYIISALTDLKDIATVAERLLKNQDDIGNAMKPFYGEKFGNKLAALLREHIVLATQVIAAAKAEDTKKLDKYSDKWYTNADDIALFLYNKNLHWSIKELQAMLCMHLEHTTGEVVSRLEKKWRKDIGFYDKNHNHMLMFSDFLVRGIAKQFPKKFKA